MSQPRFGQQVPELTSKEITSDHNDAPGLGWEVSDETLREIEEIEQNIRWAEQNSGYLLMG
jgi:hypothetical protein